MSEFNPEEEARNAALTAEDGDGPFVSWGAIDYYRTLPQEKANQWKEAYLSALRTKYNFENPEFNSPTGPID